MARQAKSNKKTAATAARPAKSAGTKSTAAKAVGRAKASPAPAAKKPAKQAKAAAKPTSSKKVKSEPKPHAAAPASSAKSSSAKSAPKAKAVKASGAKPGPESVEDFLASLPDPAVAEGLRVLRKQLGDLMPKGSWDKVFYGSIPIYHDPNGRKVIGYGRAGNKCSLYVIDIPLVQEWGDKGLLKHPGLKYTVGSTLHFDPKLGVPPEFLKKLVEVRLERAAASASGGKEKGSSAKSSGCQAMAKGARSKAKK